MAFQLPDLPYAKDALEPYIDAQTMELHHGKHHAGYVKKLNAAVEAQNLQEASLEALLAGAGKHGSGVRNNGGGHYNHSLFWITIGPNCGGEPTGDLMEAIVHDLGGLTPFIQSFEQAATSRFGSGWAWLIVQNGKLKVCSTPNQDNPLMDVAETQGIPILGLDVWEHAYYLKYQNRRADYVKAFWDIVNWRKVSENFAKARQNEMILA